MRLITDEERRARLARRHFLSVPAVSVEEVARDVVALHSTDPTTVYLSAYARVPGFSRDDLERAMYDERSLVRIVGMRRTLWVAPGGFAATINEACTRAHMTRERARTARMVEEGGIAEDGERWVRAAERKTLKALEEAGEATGAELTRAVPELAGKITFYKRDGSVLTTMGLVTRMLFLLATEGKVIRTRPQGSWVSGMYRWTTMEAWLGGDLERLDPASARSELVAAWLAGFGPGTIDDIAWWMGWTKGHTQRALADAAAVEVEVESGPAWVTAGDDEPADVAEPSVALLPSLDPTTMGWKERSWYLGDDEPSLFDRNGNAGPTIWVDGRVVGGWAQRPTGEVAVEVLTDIGRKRRAEIARRAAEMEDWLAGTVVSPRFKSPLHDEIRDR
jgi:hypothetical protein